MSSEQQSPEDEAMTNAQASRLAILSEEAGETFDSGLSRAAASKRIDELLRKTGRGQSPLEVAKVVDAGDGGSSIRANEAGDTD
jgi:Protein of unknown function (DUF3072)